MGARVKRRRGMSETGEGGANRHVTGARKRWRSVWPTSSLSIRLSVKCLLSSMVWELGYTVGMNSISSLCVPHVKQM